MKALDLEAACAALGPEQVRRLCMAAIALHVAVRNENADGAATPQANWGTIQDTAWDAIGEVMEAAGIGGGAAVPDMNAMGVRACKGCGCTDDRACPEGCCWVTKAMCSTCVANSWAAAAGFGQPAVAPPTKQLGIFGDRADG